MEWNDASLSLLVCQIDISQLFALTLPHFIFQKLETCRSFASIVDCVNTDQNINIEFNLLTLLAEIIKAMLYVLILKYYKANENYKF